MLSCGAIFTRTGPLNTSTTIGWASKGAIIQRHVSTITRNKFLKSQLLGVLTPQSLSEVQSRVLAPHIIFKCISTTYARSQCLRKIHTHLLARSSANTDVTNKTEIRHISKGEPTEDSVIDLKHIFNDHDAGVSADAKALHAPHPPKKRELKLGEIEILYPHPKSKVNEIFQYVGSQLKRPSPLSSECRHTKKGTTNVWQFEYKITWPESVTITGTASSKPGASRLASLKVLQWLHSTGKILNGVPIVYDSKDITDLFNKPTPIVIKDETLGHVRKLLENYESEVKDIIANSSNTHSIRDVLLTNNTAVDPVVRSVSKNQEENLKRRNFELLDRLECRRLRKSKDLPITEYKQRIVEEIANSRALLIKGDTGCGKTTQVPQYIMDSFTERGEATHCNMIISQPRRISAISLAERIADERDEQVGDVVGYQVRLKQIMPDSSAGMLFCTTGILLRKLQRNPSLIGYSHVVLDEAHERSINTDMLLVLLKRALQMNHELKVVIMSATINADLFQKYFDCGVIDVPGRTFPVQMNFLEDIAKLGIRPSKHYVGDADVPEVPYVDCEQISDLITWISRYKPPGAILCFLPGWAEITKVKKFLEDGRGRRGSYMIVPVHSRMTHQDQRKIFQHPPTGIRKIVLATDIAETGITVTDVVYVVDSATRKAMRWHEKKGIASMDNQYASQSNIMQRKGRAGRVQSGTSYHFVTKAQFDNLDPHPLPEVLCSSLEQTVLDCKTYSNEKAVSFLGSMPQPPTSSAIQKALHDLSELGALDVNENLTPLGKRIALFTMHPKLSKAMVYSSIFQCVAPIITIASAMSSDSEIFSGTLQDKEVIRRVKQKYHSTSDHISIGWIFAQWAEYARGGRNNTLQFCRDSRLIPDRMYILSKVRDLNADHLVQCRMLNHIEEYANPESDQNEYSTLDELVRGILLSGLDQLLFQRDFEMRKGKLKKGTNVFIMSDGHRATVTQESVNFKNKCFPSPFLTYVNKQHSEERRTSLIRETSMVSPVTALLFTQARIHGYQRETGTDVSEQKKEIILTIKGRKNFKLSCDEELAHTLLQFRDSMWNVVRYLVEYQGFIDNSYESNYYKVEKYKRRMLQVLGKMLSEAAERIDEPAVTNKPSRSSRNDEDSDEEE